MKLDNQNNRLIASQGVIFLKPEKGVCDDAASHPQIIFQSVPGQISIDLGERKVERLSSESLEQSEEDNDLCWSSLLILGLIATVFLLVKYGMSRNSGMASEFQSLDMDGL